jgi:hypothetical protein
MNATLISQNRQVVGAENKIAAVLTVVPGLGHIYKGHYATGFIWMFVGMPVALWIGILLSLATAGAGLLVPIACWAGLAFDAYYERDLSRHHWLMPMTDGSEEDDDFID